MPKTVLGMPAPTLRRVAEVLSQLHVRALERQSNLDVVVGSNSRLASGTYRDVTLHSCNLPIPALLWPTSFEGEYIRARVLRLSGMMRNSTVLLVVEHVLARRRVAVPLEVVRKRSHVFKGGSFFALALCGLPI